MALGFFTVFGKTVGSGLGSSWLLSLCPQEISLTSLDFNVPDPGKASYFIRLLLCKREAAAPSPAWAKAVSETQRPARPRRSPPGPLEGDGGRHRRETEPLGKTEAAPSPDLLLIIPRATLLTTHISANPRCPGSSFTLKAGKPQALSDQRSGTKSHGYGVPPLPGVRNLEEPGAASGHILPPQLS